MTTSTPLFSHSVGEAVDEIIRRTGGVIKLGMPLGLGKPNRLVNELYRRAERDPDIQLTIYTALSLGRPRAGTDLEKRFLEPFVQRVFGDYEELDYLAAVGRDQLPANISVKEFFFAPASMLGSETAQQNYISANYTHVARDLNNHGVNVVAQLVASRGEGAEQRLSLSSNPEVSLDLYPLLRERRDQGETIIAVAQIHEDMPYMVNDAEVSPDWFDLVIDDPSTHTTLFGTPSMPVSLQDHFVGLHASTLVRDGGTVQIGIGALGDALVHHILNRQHDNELYLELLAAFGYDARLGETVRQIGGTAGFDHGLFGCSEMFTLGLMDLIDGGVIRRQVFDDENLQRLLNEGRLQTKLDGHSLDVLRENGVLGDHPDQVELDWLHRFGFVLAPLTVEGDALLLPNQVSVPNDLSHPATREALKAVLGERLLGGIHMLGGFFLGPHSFYRRLREMDETERRLINMTHISRVNALYGDEELKRLQRRDARFMNTAFTMTLMGAAVSDQIGDGRVLSGVGGQYNFVSQAHELTGGRSILMLRSWRERGNEVSSNIVFSYPHNTIPRHLRDLVVTEYGIADLRGGTDSECIAAMLNISDSRFQASLLEEAQKAGKMPADYRIPEMYRHNTPERLRKIADGFSSGTAFTRFPLGSDFTTVEQDLVHALTWLKGKSEHRKFLELGRKVFFEEKDAEGFREHLERMGLYESGGVKQRLYRRLLLTALNETAS